MAHLLPALAGNGVSRHLQFLAISRRSTVFCRRLTPRKGGSLFSSETYVTRRYEQQLSRAIGVLGNICITVSGITPTASIFIIAPVAFANQGSGSFLTFVIAGIIGVGMAMCYSELGSAFPIVAGQTSIVARGLARPVGFLAFVDFLALAIFIPSAIALGAGQY